MSVTRETGASRTRPLHVLTLTPFYPSQNDETNGCFIAEPIQELARLGVANTVIAVEPFYRGKREVQPSGVPTTWLRYFSVPGRTGLSLAGAFVFAGIVAKVRALQRSNPVDLVHAHGPLPAGHAAMLLESELKIPYVVSVHGLDAFSSEQETGQAARWRRSISQRVYRSARRVICISERVREEVLAGIGKASRTSVVYNGVDADRFSPKDDPRNSGLTVLSVGNLIPSKGHDLLIRATAGLKEEFSQLSLEIIGEGPELARLEGIARQLGVQHQVRFLGRRPRDEVAAAMRRCTVFALPSRYEGLGCVYLEAMATAKPVIGCRGQGIAEVIKQGANGFLVGPENEAELTLALGILLRDEQRRRNLGTAARDTILDRFTLAIQSENLLRIYRESVA